MDTTTDNRLDTITSPTTYGLFHEGLLIYVGATTQSLDRRLGGHINKGTNNTSTARVHDYIRTHVDNPENDLSIKELGYNTEQEALDAYGEDTLNDQLHAAETSYGGYDWSSEELDVLESHSILEASKRLDASFNACRRAAHRLGLVDDRQYTKVDWSKWDDLLGTMSDQDLADQIGCTINNVQRRRSKLGIEPYGDADAFSLALTKEEAAEVYIDYHVNDKTYDDLAEEHNVGTATIGRIIRGETYDDLSRDHLDAIVDRAQALLGDREADGPEALLDKAIV